MRRRGVSNDNWRPPGITEKHRSETDTRGEKRYPTPGDSLNREAPQPWPAARRPVTQNSRALFLFHQSDPGSRSPSRRS